MIEIGEGGYRVESLQEGGFVSYEARTGFDTGASQFYGINLRLDDFGEATTQVDAPARMRGRGRCR